MTFREYVASLLTLLTCNYLDFVSTTFLTIFSRVFTGYTPLILILPAIMNLRGCNYVTYSSRLVAKMHLGYVKTDEGLLQDEVKVELLTAFTCVMASNLLVALTATIVLMLMSGLKVHVQDLTNLVDITLMSGMLTAIIILPIVTLTLMYIFRRGLRPELFVGPLESIFGDVLTVPLLTLSYMIVLTVLTNIYLKIMVMLSFMLLMLFLFLKVRTLERRQVSSLWRPTRVIIEVLSAALVSSIVELVVGFIIVAKLDTMLRKSILLFTFIPPLLAACGSICIRFCVEVSTLLHLGIIMPSLKPAREVLSRLCYALSQLAVLYTNIAVMCVLYASLLKTWIDILIPLTMFITGLLAGTLMLLVGYYITILCFRRGVNPANISGPVIMPLCDLTTSLIYSLVVTFI